jgi:hypothetical protein
MAEDSQGRLRPSVKDRPARPAASDGQKNPEEGGARGKLGSPVVYGGEGFEPSSDPKAQNRFRDPYQCGDLQGLSCGYASLCASQPQPVRLRMIDLVCATIICSGRPSTTRSTTSGVRVNEYSSRTASPVDIAQPGIDEPCDRVVCR